MDHLALLGKKALHGTAKPAVDDVVHAGGMLRVQTTKLFEASAGARLEPLQSHADRVLDGGVVTNIEMQKRMFLETAPIPAVHRGVIAHIECPGDNLALALGKHEERCAAKRRCRSSKNSRVKYCRP